MKSKWKGIHYLLLGVVFLSCSGAGSGGNRSEVVSVEKGDIYLSSGILIFDEHSTIQVGQQLQELGIFQRTVGPANLPDSVVRAAQDLVDDPMPDEMEAENVRVDSGRLVAKTGQGGDGLYAFLTTLGNVCLVFEDGAGACVDSPLFGAAVAWDRHVEKDESGMRIFGLTEDRIATIEVELASGRLLRANDVKNGFAFRIAGEAARSEIAQVRVVDKSGSAETLSGRA